MTQPTREHLAGLGIALEIVRSVAKMQAGYNDEREAIYEALVIAHTAAKAAPEGEAVKLPSISGIGRDLSHPRAVVLYLRSEPTDDDLRAIMESFRSTQSHDADLVELLMVARSELALVSHGQHSAVEAGHVVERIDAKLTELKDKTND